MNEPDEGRYAEIGREMAATGEWLVPHLNGFEHFQKPPLLYWFTAASIRCFGVNDWAARLPSAIAALGVVLLTHGIARRIADPATAVAAVLVLTSSIGFFTLARLLTPDMLLTFWVTAAIGALISHRQWLFFICMGLGFLTKGPMALVVPISAAIAWQFAPTAGERRSLPWVRGTALTLSLGLSWFVVLSIGNGALFDYFWRYELVERFTSSARGRSRPFWFFVPVLLIGLLPWTLFLVERFRDLWMKWRSSVLLNADALLVGWIFPPLVILSFSGSKLPTDILPLFPALSMLIARDARVQKLQWRIAIPVTCVWLAAAAAVPLLNDHLDRQASLRTLAAVVQRRSDAGEAEIFTCELRAHGLAFYLSRLVSTTRPQSDLVLPPNQSQQSRLFDTPEAMQGYFAGRDAAYGIVRPERFQRTFDPRHWTILAKAGDFLLISNQPPVEKVSDSASALDPVGAALLSGPGENAP